ncbi:hypothetical protein [Crystallibacter crystallopoietes]|uniref:hypothetical protein n=1 Tax=Crystallibacter crystallopoietes TaxID=37928 RepID=UPI0002E1D231
MEDKPPRTVRENTCVYMVLAPGARGNSDGGAGRFRLQPADATGAPTAPAAVVSSRDLPEAVRALEKPSLRWVWHNTRSRYLPLLRAGVSVDRCHDLSLARNILALSEYAAGTPYVRKLRERGTSLPADAPEEPAPDQFTLFDAQPAAISLEDLLQELQDQLAAVAGSPSRDRLQLLLAAESAGAWWPPRWSIRACPGGGTCTKKS